MSLPVAALVLLAALLHASWNAIVRVHGDRLGAITMLAGVGALIAALLLPFVPVPPPAAWPWLAASVALHLGYNVFLANAYQHGELGKVYPLARGAAPLVTLLIGTLAIGEPIAAHAVAGILLLGAGIITLALDQGLRGLVRAPRGVGFALITSLFIAGYSVVDGLGARTAGNAHSYTVYLFLFDGVPLALYALVSRRGQTLTMLRESWRPGIVAGALSMAAYWIVIWAMTVAPIALVAALRETSVVFALIIGVVFLREPLTAPRTAAIAIVAAGLILMRL